MAPNITEEDAAIMAEKAWYQNQPSTQQKEMSKNPSSDSITDTMLTFYSSMKHYALRLYIVFWRKLQTIQ